MNNKVDEKENDSEFIYSDEEQMDNISDESEGDELLGIKELQNISQESNFFENDISDTQLDNSVIFSSSVIFINEGSFKKSLSDGKLSFLNFYNILFICLFFMWNFCFIN